MRIKIALYMIFAAGVAHAESFVCENGQPVLTINQPLGQDAGLPGAVFIGAHSPDKTKGAFLDAGNQWQAYQGGLYPARAVYSDSLPATVTYKVTLPNSPTNTSAYAGWQIYVGQGAYTQQASQLVATRRTRLNAVRADRIRAGTWNAAYDDDSQFRFALIQKDMQQNNKYRSVTVVSLLDCNATN